MLMVSTDNISYSLFRFFNYHSSLKLISFVVVVVCFIHCLSVFCCTHVRACTFVVAFQASGYPSLNKNPNSKKSNMYIRTYIIQYILYSNATLYNTLAQVMNITNVSTSNDPYPYRDIGRSRSSG